MDDLAYSCYLILRTPAMPAADFRETPQKFLDDPLFCAALYLASPVFYSRIASSGFLESALNKKEYTSLLKYINRICFRPTPFGLFSSVALAEWGGETNEPFNNGDGPEIAVSPDELFVANLLAGESQGIYDKTIIHKPNPSIYRAGEEYRFIQTGLDDSGRIREYRLQSIAYSKLLKDLINFCSSGRTSENIIETICGLAACTPEEGWDYFDFLQGSQLLQSEFQTTINGAGHLMRMLKLHKWPARVKEGLEAVLEQMKLPNPNARYLKELSSTLYQHIPAKAGLEKESLLNVISHFKERGALHDKYKEILSNGLYALSILCPREGPPALKSFIREFNLYFEGRRIPLLKIIDPEIGIGYQQPLNEQNNVLLETLHIEQKVNNANTLEWSAAHSYLLRAWHVANESGNPVVEVLADDLLQMEKGLPEHPSCGMSVLFRLTGEQVFIESAGGNNTVALMGRFTPADPAIHMAALETAAVLEKSNPEIIFAEILHASDPYTDNVNRREQIWSWELPITAAASPCAARQLDLADLYVTVEQGMIILRSEKYGKVVVPRLSSAYNHSLNKLPLFRFLADLPYQYGQYALTLDLRQYFPGLNHYPRVIYKKAIIHPATWIINEPELKKLRSAGEKDQAAVFRTLTAQLRIPPQFLLSEGDQQLVFNHSHEEDIDFFISCIAQKNEVVLKEFLTETVSNDTTKPDKKLRIKQYNAFLYPTKPLRFRPGMASKPSLPRDQRKFLPGSEWLYLKIYTPKAGISRLLLRLLPLVSRSYPNGKITKWFFIRYEDHAPHLRLRMQVNPADISHILKVFKEKLETGINEHVIREYQVDVYSRELERYRASAPGLTEDHFWASSELVAGFLKLQKKNPALNAMTFALFSVHELLTLFIPQPAQQIAFSFDNYERFSFEFKDTGLKVELDKQYRKLSPLFLAEIADRQYLIKLRLSGQARRFIRTALKLRNSANRAPGYHTLIESMIHMHLNRLFTDDARKQEMIIYYFLYKYMRSVTWRKKNGEPED